MLDTGDASPLSTSLPGRNRSKEITITALANLAKFQGRYERFQEIKKRYDLKWSTSNSTQYFERFFNEGLTLDVMLQRIRQMISLLPQHMGSIIKFACLVGLRASEVLEAVRLLNEGRSVYRTTTITFTYYYNPERQVLEHFRFPEIFIRTTKKAYISFLSTDNYHWIANLGPKTPSLNAITLACRRRGLKMEMHLARKIFASYMRLQAKIEPEIVDLLQGRVSPSILTRHYLVPSNTLKDDVLLAVEKLQREL